MNGGRQLTCAEVLEIACRHLEGLAGHIFDVLDVSKPVSPEAATFLAKVISKLSPLVGNMIEFNAVELLNDQAEFAGQGEWRRQDPGFPDTIFVGNVQPVPGFEIKAWFPLATEITARFRDSQNHFVGNNTNVALLAWLPERLIYGRPRIVDVCVVSALSVAAARDGHYHNPPDYLVLEPEDTRERTRNLQQTNTAGYKWQGRPSDFKLAEEMVRGWGADGRTYRPTPEYQATLRELTARFPYRLDTNFAKIDRIAHPELEAFKTRVEEKVVFERSVAGWVRLFARGSEAQIQRELEEKLDIREENAEKLVQ